MKKNIHRLNYIINGKFKSIPFTFWSEKEKIQEDIEVSEGEEGRRPIFLCVTFHEAGELENSEVIEKNERLDWTRKN